MDLAKTSPLFHMSWKWKFDVEQCHSLLANTPHKLLHFEPALTCINRVVSMVLQTLCEINDCLCLEYVYPIVDEMYRFLQPFFVTFPLCIDEPDVFYLESIVEKAGQAKLALCEMLYHCCHGHAQLLSQYMH